MAEEKPFQCQEEWNVNDFSSRPESRTRNSPTLTIVGSNTSNWEFILEPLSFGGEPREANIFLSLLSRETDSPIRAHYRFSIYDAKGRKRIINASHLHICDIKADEESTILVKHISLTEMNELIFNGYLRMLCELDIIEAEKVPNNQLHKNFGDFLEPDQFSDVKFVVDGQEYPAHKIILAAHSPVLAAMFNNEMKEKNTNQVEIIDIDRVVFKGMLTFMYGGKVENLDEIADRLLAVADMYDIIGLKLECGDALGNRLDIENAASTLILAHRHNASKLKAQVINFIVENNEEVLNTEGWKLLNNQPHSSLFRDLFNALSRKFKRVKRCALFL